jgi:hypothetical protein
MLVLIDGDIFRYRCGFAAERNYYLVDLLNPNEYRELKEFDSKKEANQYIENVTKGVHGARCRLWSRKDVQPLENCLQIIKGSLTQTLEDIKNAYPKEEIEYRIFLSGPTNFRQNIAVTKPYKGNRDDNAKPTYYKELGVYLRETWAAVDTEGIEADDAIGIAAMEAKDKGRSYLVVSNDKDLDQISGVHYNWTTKEFYTVSPKAAKTSFFVQVLAGDSTDNIPGIPGIGKATAEKILSECKSPEDMVDLTFQEYRDYLRKKFSKTMTQQIHPTDDYAMNYFKEQVNLVYILKKKGDTWFDTKDGLYWENKYEGVPH